MAASPRRRATSVTGFSRTAVVTGITLLIGVIGVTGCAADAPTDAGGAPAEAPAPAVVDGGERAGADVGTDAGAPTPVQERALIYTGSVTVQVESVASAADEAIAIVVGLNGIVAGDNRTIEDEKSQATLVFRVPADRFASTLDRLARLGTEESRQVQAQDVTEQLVDLDARIATQQASVDRVRELLARAQTIAEIVSLESELTRRQAELDSLTQRRATMAGLVDLATITLILHGPSGSTDEEPETGFVAGLRAGWAGLLVSLEILLTLTGWLLPWAVVFGLPVLVIVLAVRRRRRRQRAATPPAPTLARPVVGPPTG
ncbi:MAG: DUF4349 domain-containing protein, partial [Micromonosporaceae bacterium]|nr:DUF4349 domain-containing protein [Micromonosporaceae bacterium]